MRPHGKIDFYLLFFHGFSLLFKQNKKNIQNKTTHRETVPSILVRIHTVAEVYYYYYSCRKFSEKSLNTDSWYKSICCVYDFYLRFSQAN